MPITSTEPDINVQQISERELAEYQAYVKGTLFRQIRKRFRQLKQDFGFTQAHLAKRLGVDEGLLSRRLHGDKGMRLETLSDLARGMDCRIDVKLTPLTDIGLVDLDNHPFRVISNPAIEKAPVSSVPASDKPAQIVKVVANIG